MANTEGLPDEFVESLMMTPVTTTRSNKPKRRGKAISKRIQERMNIPLKDGKPSAKIIRSSPRGNSEFEKPEQEDPSADDTNMKSMFSSLMVGEVVEHKAPTRRKKNESGNASSKTKKGSRFKQQARLQQNRGFPSVHLPMGTFVKPSTKTKKAKKVSIIGQYDEHKDKPLDEVANESNIQEASQRDARNLLSQMSSEEIKQHQTDLEVALSPDLKAFLKKRRTNKKNKDSSETTTAATASITLSSKPVAFSRHEKERFANLLSDVKSHQDLDTAYNNEMRQVHPLEHEVPAEKDHNDDFFLACDLLRSSVPRQTLWAARCVSQKLLQNREKKLSRRHEWPLLLPISLRCLLDETIEGIGKGLLHTYVLQSLYSLLILNSKQDHAILVGAVSNIANDDNFLYQDCFLEDNIPTPPLTIAYPTNTVHPLSVDNTVAAYSTSSSSQSAMDDAKAFEMDPMWTLLSKLKIIPRLAQLLKPQHSLPDEAWTASCGILCMLSQRSPGAASAIVHHETLLPRILEKCLTNFALEKGQVQEESRIFLLEQLALAALQLLVTLARQSRVTSKAIVPHMEEIIPPLLLPNISSCIEIPKMAIILWRTLLRYGLGLAGLATMLKLAAHHWALPYDNENSLSIEYLSAVTQVLNCARVAKSKVFSSTTTGMKDNSPITDESILSMGTTHLAVTRRQILPLIPMSDVVTTDNSCLNFRWNAARLRFLTAFWSIPEASFDDEKQEEIKTEELSMEDQLLYLEALDVWSDPGGKVEVAWEVARGTAGVQDTKKEAAACAFLASSASFLVTLDTSRTQQSNRMVSQLTRAVVTHFTERILSGLKSMADFSREVEELNSLAKQGWINQCNFALAKLLFHAFSVDLLTSSSDMNLVKQFVFSLLGSLDRGNESIAAVLFSQDILFTPNGSPLHEEYGANSSSSPISSMFLGEICGSERSRKQLDHSFKLQHGFGITSAGFGPFALDSLLSEADQVGPRSSETGELFLPLGKLWLWQTLSGFIRVNQGAVERGTREATNVVSSILGILLELEEEVEVDSTSSGGFTSLTPIGTKLYYLMNVCLHSEVVLRDDRVIDSAEAVLDRYCQKLDDLSIVHFSKACYQHTELPKQTLSGGDQELEATDKKLLEELLNHPDSYIGISLSQKEMRALEALLEDLVSAYRDFGAQYAFFTKCMRLFLSPIFPSSIRCRTLRELRGIIHLLTLPEEYENVSSMSKALAHSLSGGLPVVDGSTRDSSSLLDAIVSMLLQESKTRPLDGFILNYSVATLARNLAISMSEQRMTIQSIKKRLEKLDNRVITLVCDVTSIFLREGASKTNLVKATIGTTSSSFLDHNVPVINLDERFNVMAKLL
jgi:hypothetical protein